VAKRGLMCDWFTQTFPSAESRYCLSQVIAWRSTPFALTIPVFSTHVSPWMYPQRVIPWMVLCFHSAGNVLL
jgi:hypothetical protein